MIMYEDSDNFIQNNRVYNLDAITFLECMYEDYGDESMEMFLVDFPYTFKRNRKPSTLSEAIRESNCQYTRRVTANKWDLPVDIDRFFELALKMLTPEGVIALTASQPFTSHLVYNHLDCFKYEWIWEKDNGSNFVHVKHQPFKVHESILIFGKAPTTYNKAEKYMTYNPQFSEGKPYKVKRSGMTDNLATSNGYERTDGEYDGKRYPRSIQKFNTEKGLHPTQKPTDLFEYLIKTHTNEGDTVVDCCCGSGTTGVAAKRCGRNYIINDVEMKYADISEDRLSKIS